MRRWLLPTGALGILLMVGLSAVSAPAAPKQVKIELRLLHGDPLGSAEEGTLKVYAEPRLFTLDDRPCEFRSGGEVAVKRGEGQEVLTVTYGHVVMAKAKLLTQGQVFLDVTFERTMPSKERKGRTLLNTASARLLGTFRVGEVVKLPLEGRPARDQIWVEMVVVESDKK